VTQTDNKFWTQCWWLRYLGLKVTQSWFDLQRGCWKERLTWDSKLQDNDEEHSFPHLMTHYVKPVSALPIKDRNYQASQFYFQLFNFYFFHFMWCNTIEICEARICSQFALFWNSRFGIMGAFGFFRVVCIICSWTGSKSNWFWWGAGPLGTTWASEWTAWATSRCEVKCCAGGCNHLLSHKRDSGFAEWAYQSCKMLAYVWQ